MTDVQPLADPNRGPLKLKYDATPRDLAQPNPSTDNLQTDNNNFRYQGYPQGQFERSSKPVTSNEAVILHDKQIQQTERSHARRQYLQTGQPIKGSQSQGFQYGSENELVSKQVPRPVRDPFKEKTTSELQTFRRQMADAEAEINKYKQEKQLKMQSDVEQKKKDLIELQSYNPWGKPGGGAPSTVELKKKNVSNDAASSVETSSSSPKTNWGDSNNAEYIDRSFGKPGGGAPMRTKSGQLKAAMSVDTNIRFQEGPEGEKLLEGARYKQPDLARKKYASELEAQLNKKTVEDRQNQLAELRKDIELIKYGATTLPGASPRTEARNTKRKITLTRHPKEMKIALEKHPEIVLGSEFNRRPSRVLSEPEYGKTNVDFGQGVGHPKRDKFGNLQPKRWSDRTTGGETLALGEKGGAGAPIRDNDGNIITARQTFFARNDQGDVRIKENSPRDTNVLQMDEENNYNPWGKPGAGAPQKDEAGNLKTGVYGRILGEASSSNALERREKSRSYLDEMRLDAEAQQRRRKKQEAEVRKGGGELASVIRGGNLNNKVGYPKRDPNTGLLSDQRLSLSDVIKDKTDHRKYKDEQSDGLFTFLERQALERERNKQLDQLEDREQAKKHQETEWFGKPGAGAPVADKKRKGNLDQMLHKPRVQPEAFYEKRIDKQPATEEPTKQLHKNPATYVRSTVNSTHRNGYEFETAHRLERKKEHKLPVPFATQSEEVM